MDKRGYTVDPNRDSCKELDWYEQIGPTQRPSPYATASWVYLQKYVVEMVRGCGTEESLIFDNYSNFSVWLYDFILNGGEFNHDRTDAPVYDSGAALNTPFIKHIFASVKVYDSLASYPGDCGDLEVDPGFPPPGDLLGELSYEMVDCKVFITDWSHYNWMDDTPVRKAFKAMVNSLPAQVSEVTVRDTPHAFWTSLGFIQKKKGDQILVYSDPKAIKPY